jgi:hypothetical protein
VKRMALAGLLAAVLGACPATAAQPRVRVVGFSRIGDFKVHGGTVGFARKAFGRAVRTREVRGRSCELTWPGVRISFYTLAHDRQCRPDTPFGSAWITGAWVTERGLRQGDTVAKARRSIRARGGRTSPVATQSAWSSSPPRRSATTGWLPSSIAGR